MAQTAVKRISSRGDTIDYTASSNVTAGDVVQIGTVPYVATQAITNGALGSLACDGIFDVPKTSDVFAAGDAVYWNPTGSPVTGTASSGAADNATGNYAGMAIANAANTASYVRVQWLAGKRATVIGGAVTASGITGEDSSLGITGIAGNAGAGGAIPIAGGAGDGNAAGGAVSVTGGAGAGTGAGGAASVVGGLGGTTGAGGAVAVTGGQGGATSGAAGAVAITGGAGSNTAGDGAAVTITGGAATNNNDNGGAVTINGGAKHGTGADGAISIGVTNASSITMGKAPRFPVTLLNAAGSTQADGGALVEGFNVIAAQDNTTCVVLPSCVNGAWCVVVNQATDKTLNVFPPVSKQINGAGANNAVSMAANTIDVFFSEGTNSWRGFTAAVDLS